MFSKTLLSILIITIISENSSHPFANIHHRHSKTVQTTSSQMAQIPRLNQQKSHQSANFLVGSAKTHQNGQFPNHFHQNGFTFGHGVFKSVDQLNQIPFLKQTQAAFNQIPMAFTNLPLFPHFQNNPKFGNAQIPLINRNIPTKNSNTAQNPVQQFPFFSKNPHNPQQSLINEKKLSKLPNSPQLPRLSHSPKFASPIPDLKSERSFLDSKSFSNEPLKLEMAQIEQNSNFPLVRLSGMAASRSKSSDQVVRSDENDHDDDDDDEEETYDVPNISKEPDPRQYSQYNQDNFIQDDFRDVKFPSSGDTKDSFTNKFSDLEEYQII